MLKKSLAWVLTMALLLSTLSGLALISSAATDAKFAYVSYESGAPLYKNATQNLDTVTAKGGSTSMSEITGNEDDAYAYLMGHQNDQLGINVPATLGIGANAIIEVTFWTDADNLAGTRLGLNYTTANGQTGYSDVQLTGSDGAELTVSNLDGAIAEVVGTEGWKTFKVTLTDADFNNNGQVNIVKWSHDNGDNTPDGWYIKSILVYDAAEGAAVPDEEDLYIRQDVIGYIDFSAEEAYAELLSYTADGSASEVMADEMNALKLSNKALTITADDAKHPAVVATDAAVSVLAEVKIGDGAWQVLRKDITDNTGVSFDLATLLFGEADGDIYVRKVVVARTSLIVTYTNDSAFVDFEDPYALYNDFQNVKDTNWKFTWDFEGGEGENYEIKSDDGKAAIYANGGYWRLNVDDAFTKHNSADIADMAIEITYLDKGTGTLKIQYNTVLPDGAEDPIPYNFKNQDILTLEDSGEWKTTTVYLSDAQFRNAANGADFRIPMGDLAGAGVSAVKVTIGADKTALNEWIAKPINVSKYTEESMAAYNTAKTAATTVQENLYATKAQVDEAVANMSAAFDALVAKDGDPRFALNGAMWDSSKSNGEIMILDGWYCWAFPSNASGNWLGIGDENGILNDSTSVTYQYEILMDTANNNDRCFLSHGTKDGWVNIKEGAPPENNGYAAGGQWGKVPAVGRWGVIEFVNDNFDPNSKSGNGNITELGSWFDNGTLYVRSVKVFDTEDPSKFIQLQFKEDVAELIVEGGDADVALTEKDGSEAYVIPSGWKALNINVPSLLEQGVVSEETQYAMIEFEYFLDDSDNGNELLMIKHYNPDGTGQNGDKSAVCEHQLSHAELTKRNQWARAKFLLDDCLFGADNKTLNITYGNGSNIYIRGIKVYEADENGEMVSEKPAQWGVFEMPEIVSDFAFYDWDTDQSYGMSVSFSEGATATEFKAIDGRVAAIITDDMMYVKVDEDMISADQKFVRIDIHHEMGTVMYARYNKIVPEGIDTSAEPYLTQYNFHASGENQIIDEETNENVWITTEDDFVNMLGVVKPTEDSADWTVTSIYLNDAQFRDAANGSDFRIHIIGGGAIVSRVEVHAITEEDYNTAKAAVGDMTELKALYNETVEKYGDDMPDAIDYALEDAQYFMDFGYRASQEAIDEALAALKAAVEEASVTLGDVNGDGKINTSDARVILQYAAGIESAKDIDTAAADVTKDGKVNTSDARKILQFAANIITEF